MTDFNQKCSEVRALDIHCWRCAGLGTGDYFCGFILYGRTQDFWTMFALSMFSWSKKSPELCVRHLDFMYYLYVHLYIHIYVCLTKASELRWKLSKARTSLSICSPTGKLREAVSLKSSCTSFRVVWLCSPTVRWGAQSQVSILALRILNVVQKHRCVIKQPWRLRSVSLNLLKLRRQLK